MKAPNRPERVLIAEDNSVNQSVASLILESLGYSAVLASDGVLAVEACRGTAFDLILMDLHMPGMNGYEATQAIRTLESVEQRAHPAVIIAVTADVSDDTPQRCLAAGMNAFLLKPFRSDQLKTLLEKCLSNASGMITASSQTAQAAGHPRVDLTFLREHLGLDGDETVRQLIQLFIDTSPDRVIRMRSACEGQRGKELTFEAHSLKSSSASLGLRDLSELCGKLERLGASGPPGEVLRLVGDIGHELDRSLEELRGFLTGGSPGSGPTGS